MSLAAHVQLNRIWEEPANERSQILLRLIEERDQLLEDVRLRDQLLRQFCEAINGNERTRRCNEIAEATHDLID